jgi:hypothetical protein
MALAGDAEEGVVLSLPPAFPDGADRRGAVIRDLDRIVVNSKVTTAVKGPRGWIAELFSDQRCFIPTGVFLGCAPEQVRRSGNRFAVKTCS